MVWFYETADFWTLKCLKGDQVREMTSEERMLAVSLAPGDSFLPPLERLLWSMGRHDTREGAGTVLSRVMEKADGSGERGLRDSCLSFARETKSDFLF